MRRKGEGEEEGGGGGGRRRRRQQQQFCLTSQFWLNGDQAGTCVAPLRACGGVVDTVGEGGGGGRWGGGGVALY